ncbi:hypothetical protein H7F33_17860 [Pedobacter sp. PAMC26386]|nr:hypothetical protein H7F33_17860 [Pedobacter sp. PAMC26386]
MGEQLTTSAEALRLFFTEDIYLVNNDNKILPDVPSDIRPAPVVLASVPVIEAVVAVDVVEPVVFKYLGKNQKNILILVNDGQNEVSTDKGKELLRNIVKALQLTANDFALLNYATYRNTSLDTLKSHFNSKLIFAFGVTPSHLGMGEQSVNEIIMYGGAQLIFSGNLDQLADDQTGKKTLWGSLKKLSI